MTDTGYGFRVGGIEYATADEAAEAAREATAGKSWFTPANVNPLANKTTADTESHRQL